MASASALGGGLDPAFEQHRVGAGGQVLQAFGDHSVSQDGGGSGAVAGDVIGFGGGFFEQLGAHIFEGIRQFDFFRHGHAVMGDGGGTEFAIQSHIAAFGAEGGCHSVGDNVHADL